jgi:hypothetical protein
MPVDRRDPATRATQSRGRCHLYVFPCAYEDLLKLGFSRDPLVRLQQLHPRWFAFFDLDRGFLVETESVPDARKLELRYRRLLEEHNAPQPLTVRDDAGGAREWFRGAQALLEQAATEMRETGHVVHAPLRPWLREALARRAELLFQWTGALTVEELESPCVATSAQRTVRDAIDAFDALGVDPAPWLPAAVLHWHRALR